MNSKTAQWRRIYCVLVAFEVQSCFITLATLVIQILSLAKRSPWKNVLMRLRNTQFWHCQFSNCKKAALKVRTNTVSVKVFNIPIVIQLWRLAHLDSRWCRRSCDIIKLPAACSWCFHTKRQTQDEIWTVFVSARGGYIEIEKCTEWSYRSRALSTHWLYKLPSLQWGLLLQSKWNSWSILGRFCGFPRHIW